MVNPTAFPYPRETEYSTDIAQKSPLSIHIQLRVGEAITIRGFQPDAWTERQDSVRLETL